MKCSFDEETPGIITNPENENILHLGKFIVINSKSTVIYEIMNKPAYFINLISVCHAFCIL